MEQRLAAQWAHYTWGDYLDLVGADWWLDPYSGGDSKAKVLASFRIAKTLEAIVIDGSHTHRA